MSAAGHNESTSSERRVVIVAPSFAPSSYPPAIRVRFFATHLPEFRWCPTILTVHPEYLEEPQDPEFLAMLPPELEVIRTNAVPQSFTRALHFGDLGLRSFLPHLQELKRRARRGFDALLIPGPPWYPFCLGPMIRKRFGIPYVLDYIDPWVDSVGAEARFPSKAWAAHALAVHLEKRAVRDASGFISVSAGTNETVLRRYPGLPADLFDAVPYGFEPADFERVRGSQEKSRYLAGYENNVNICYVGAMLPKAYGTVRAFFRALKQVAAENAAAQRLRIHFFGTTYAAGEAAKPLVLPVAAEEGVQEFVTEHPARVPYLDALRILVSADLIAAFGSSERHYTASKIFPNLLARRPLLAIFHEESSVCATLRTARSGRLIAVSDDRPAEARVGEIAAALREWLSGRQFPIDSAGINQVAEEYSAREMTRILARRLDFAVASARPVQAHGAVR